MKKLFVWMLTAVLALSLAACGSGNEAGTLVENGVVKSANDTAEQQVAGGEETAEEADSKETVYPLTVKDATGFAMTFDKAPERIVSTSPSETEILFALGLGDKIYGVSDFDNYPEEATAKPKVGGVTNPNEEAILAANPDLVIGGISMNDDVAEHFRSLGISLYKTDPKTVEDVIKMILVIGEITDTKAKADEVVAEMREDIRKVTDAVSAVKEADRKKVYIEFAPGWTVGSGEFLHELITIAGGVNIAADTQGWSQVNEEAIIAANPEVILFAADLVDFDSGKPLEEIITSRSGWSKITAIQENRLVPLDQDIMARTGPRITKGLLMVAEGIYPDLIQP